KTLGKERIIMRPTTIDELQVLITAQTSGLRREMGKATQQLSGVQKQAAKVATAIKTITKVGAVAGAALSAYSIKAAIDFESSFAGVRKTVEATEAEFADLEKRFRDIAKSTPITTTQLNKIGELAGQLGVRGVDNLEKFTKTIA